MSCLSVTMKVWLVPWWLGAGRENLVEVISTKDGTDQQRFCDLDDGGQWSATSPLARLSHSRKRRFA